VRLVIAEKPSLAKAIAEGLGDGAAKKNPSMENAFESGGYCITWAVGHVLEQATPDAYLPRRENAQTGKQDKSWRWADLPIIPGNWIKNPTEQTADQLKKIGRLLKKAQVVVHAGDPDREGQLIVDEILEHFHYTGKTQRVWLASMDAQSVRKAFAAIQPNSSYHLLSQSAEARSRADWLVGYNLTRAWSIRNDHTLSVGRVQTPTLAIVVRRDIAIEHFVARDFYDVQADCAVSGATFSATWTPPAALLETPSFDESQRLVDRALADRVATSARQPPVLRVEQTTEQEKSQQAPLPFNLSALQKAASAKYGFSAQQVLDICQGLYVKKVTTYPRTDCRYLPEEQFQESGAVLKKVVGAIDLAAPVADRVNAGAKHGAWNTKKVTAHHAIIPTGIMTGLEPNERKVYEMIARAYVALFLPAFRYTAQTAVLAHENAEGAWKASGRRVLDPGWKAIYGETGQEEEEDDANASGGILPKMAHGDAVPVSGVRVNAKKTQPPARFNDGTLIEAMSQVHRLVDDEKMRSLLKENAGIGTEATRAPTIEKLVEAEYLMRKGKNIISTTMGRSLIACMSDDLTNPVTTARWEEILNQMANGKIPMDAFMKGIEDFVRKQIGVVRDDVFPDQKRADCPICSAPHRVSRVESQKSKGKFYWRCNNPDATHGLLGDMEGAPGRPFSEAGASSGSSPDGDGPACPKCGKTTVRRFTRNDAPYFSCAGCRKSWWTDKDTPQSLGEAWKDRK
jgi:DNA topoisomerase-3